MPARPELPAAPTRRSSDLWSDAPGPNNAITDVPGISVGHFTGSEAGTTVVLAASTSGQGVGGGVTQRGGSPATRETDLMRRSEEHTSELQSRGHLVRRLLL